MTTGSGSTGACFDWRNGRCSRVNCSFCHGIGAPTPNQRVEICHPWQITGTLEIMVDYRTMDPIREIRCHAELWDKLVSCLDALVTGATLDKGQLVSLVDSLQHLVHGTGKSYPGVFLVRALLIIRNLWLQKVTDRSPPPIVVLCCNNHVIDEFLVHLIKTEPGAMRNRLIRLGGQCMDDRLCLDNESSTWQSNGRVIDSHQRLQELQQLRSLVRQAAEDDIVSSLSHSWSFRTKDPTERNKEVVKATNKRMEMMARLILLSRALKQLKAKGGANATPAKVIAQLKILLVTEDSRQDMHHSSMDIPTYWQKVDKEQMLPLLCLGLEPHEAHQHWGDVLLMFLSGKILLPPCEFVLNDGTIVCCRKYLDPSCDDQETGLAIARCVRAYRSEFVGVCEAHTHDVTGCRKARFDPHECCRRKFLASCLFPCCEKLCFIKGGIHCNEHHNRKCLALTKGGKPCKTPPVSRLVPYCAAHEHLHHVKMVVTAVVRQKCAAITNKEGRPCQGSGLPGQRYCYDHDFPTEETLTTGSDDIRAPETSNDATAIEFLDAVDGFERKEEKLEEKNDVDSVYTLVSVQSKSTGGSVLSVEKAARQEFYEMELEGENLERLRDVIEAAEEKKDSDFEWEDEEKSSYDENISWSENEWHESSTVHEFIDSAALSWTMNKDDRWAARQSLLVDRRRWMGRASGKVKNCVAIAYKEHQLAIIKAQAEVFENKSVIGGTMMVCVSRLESIRTTRPFAIVVEELSKVLEPLLLSCLTESNNKLELIGDHLQMHPSVMSRYEFELDNKINISMFQRLIEAPPGHQILSTVLSIQRRMRPNICDLSREHRAHVVAKEGEKQCCEQRIGDETSQIAPLTSSTMGREKPGIPPHTLLWTHKGAQNRSSVGISRINPVEATVACSLAKYLVECGIPKASITRDKGQLMEMRNMLQGGSRPLSRNTNALDVCRVNTLDRFQGVSRARLGLYFLANESYFQNEANVPKHRMRTMEHLENAGKDDSTITTLNPKGISSRGCSGNELPLCCPLHRSITKNASLASELCRGFFSEICQATLSCDQFCRLECHLQGTTHNSMCDLPMVSPRDDHPQIMPVAAWAQPCKHTSKMACWEREEIVTGTKVLPPWNKKSQIPFKFAICEHEIEVTCNELETYTANPSSVKGQRDEVFEPVCGHNMHVPCWQYHEYLSGAVDCECKQKVDVIFPRCSHACRQVPCTTAHARRSGNGTSCQEVGKVIEGTDYGPLDFYCKKNFALVCKCGHDVTAPCPEALAKSSSWPACHRKCKARNPDCGHGYELQCNLRNLVGGLPIPEAIFAVVDSQNPALPSQHAASFPECREEIQLTRLCGHIETVRCSESRITLHPCKIGVPASSPLCGHDTTVSTQNGIPDRISLLVQLVRCMRALNDRTAKEVSFDPSTFAKQKALNGLMVKMLTEANVDRMLAWIKKDPFLLLVGVAAVVKGKDLRMSSMPKEWRKSRFILNFWNEAYDSVLYLTARGELVDWDPYALQAVLVAKLHNHTLQELSQKLGELPVLSFKDPIQMNFSAKDLVKMTTNKATPDGEVQGQFVGQNEESIVLQQSLEGTPLHGFLVDIDWRGGIGALKGMHRNVEKDLSSKMKFVDSKAKPFQAIKLIENLLTKFPDPPILHLLLAAECICHNALDRALRELYSYLQKGKKFGGDFRIHPWSIVILARLDSTHSKQLLSAFVKHFPLFTYVLSDEEKSLMANDVPTDNPTRSWSDTLKDSWLELKDKYGIQSSAMDDLLELTGLKKVKEEALLLWKSALQLRRLDKATRKENPIVANYCFLGNPGTGKTTAARLFAAILHDCGVRESDVFKETTAQEAKGAGAYDFREKVAKAMGGVLFIDEAYDLDPIRDHDGKPIVNEILTLCENRRDEISVILAGYEDDFEKKLFKYNAGLRSRFKFVTFDDFDDEELALIWTGMRSKKKWQEEDGVTRVVVKRLAKLAGNKGFANAREVRIRLEKSTQEAMARLGDNFSQANMILQISDVIGEDPRLSNEKLKKVRDQIESRIGWERIKRQVDELIKVCGMNYGRELRGEPPLDVFLNRMFLGNPGTGKTTCAKLYGRLLKELGFLSNGDVVVKTASDFIGQYVGESQAKTNQILDGAKGKVLIIDEAYALADTRFGKQVLDTLVEKVQGGPSDDMAVILIGYEQKMLEMMREQNPGLTRRFPKEQAFYFDDYDESQLLEILELNLKGNQVDASLAFRQKALEVLGVQKLQTNFANAGAVEILIKGAMVKASERSSASDKIVLDDVDIADTGAERSEKSEDPLAVLDGLYRMEKVKARLEEMRRSWEVSRREGDERPNLGHFVFTGSPGTGKTTVARAVASILFGLGLLPTDKFVETSALDLQADYVGQTSTKVDNALHEAKGGLLFVDEAYNLGLGQFGKEACDALVAGMTSEKFRDVVVVIAGYAYEIHEMFKSNSGLRSRFTHFFDFPDWNPHDCGSFFKILCGKKCFETEEGTLDIISRGCSQLMTLEGWANGRDVTRLWESAKRCRDVRVYDELAAEKILRVADVEAAVNEMQGARTSRVPKVNQRPQNHTDNRALTTVAQDRENAKLMDDQNDVEDEVTRIPTLESLLLLTALPLKFFFSTFYFAQSIFAFLNLLFRIRCELFGLVQLFPNIIDHVRASAFIQQNVRALLEQLEREKEEAELQRIEEESKLFQGKLKELDEEAHKIEAERRKIQEELHLLEEEKRKHS